MIELAPLSKSIEQANLGNASAFNELVATLQPSVYRWALTFARDPDEADEITQETFVLVHRKLNQFRGESSVEGWVYLITRHVALQRHRKSRRRNLLSARSFTVPENVYNTDPGARVDRERVSEFIHYFFTTLPPRQREVFDLVDLQGHDPVAVAEMIGSRPGTVRANLFKARSAIREKILELHPAWQEITR